MIKATWREATHSTAAAALPVGVHKAQNLLQRDDIGDIRASTALILRMRWWGGRFLCFAPSFAAINTYEPATNRRTNPGPAEVVAASRRSVRLDLAAARYRATVS